MITLLESSLSKKKVLEILDFTRPKTLKLDIDYKIIEVDDFGFKGFFEFWYNKTGFEITIYYGNKSQFPFFVQRTKNKQELGYLSDYWLISSVEAIVFTTAHEQKHSLQFQNNQFRMCYRNQSKYDKFLSERDADKYGLKKLNEWREYNNYSIEEIIL